MLKVSLKMMPRTVCICSSTGTDFYVTDSARLSSKRAVKFAQVVAENLLYVCMCIRFKMAQIPQIAAQSSTGSTVTVYRVGDHVDITRGPLISTTQQIGRFTVTAVTYRAV